MGKSKYIPPVLVELYHRVKCNDRLYYYDSFKKWEDAVAAAAKYGAAYESNNIFDQVAKATQEVRAGRALYEQDGVLFHKSKNIYELLASLYYVALHTEKLSICDIGGALGSTYFRYRHILPLSASTWNIVEQKHYVKYGKQNVPEIDFYDSPEECFEKKPDINTVLLLSVLPYLDEPYGMLDRIFRLSPKYIVIDETVFNRDNKEEEHIVLQHVPASIYEAVYPSHIFNKTRMITAFTRAGYRKVFEWKYPGGSIPIRTRFGFKETVDKGFLFEKTEEDTEPENKLQK